MKRPKVLIVEADCNLSRRIAERLIHKRFEVIAVADKQSSLHRLRNDVPDVAILGSTSEEPCRELDLAKESRALVSTLPIILLVRRGSEESAIEAIKTGVRDYFREPFPIDEIVNSILRCMPPALGRAPQAPATIQSAVTSPSPIVGVSSSISAIKSFLERIAATDTTVLITGETGTGKELVAESIHHRSARADQPFERFNCAAIPDTLLESELFGHEKGAFTGATFQRNGVLQRAAGGTVLLDEVGDMSPLAQAKILRFIEHREIQRIGGAGSRRLDIRIIAATNQNLEDLVAQHRFRKDLYFRLNVVRLHLPPLRGRREDIPLLLKYFVEFFNLKMGREVLGFREDAVQLLMRHGWPGNVRELKNVVEASIVSGAERWISIDALPMELQGCAASTPVCESDLITRTLFSTNWNKTKAATSLRWSRMTLYRKMARYGIKKSPPLGDHAPAESVTS